MKQFVVSDPLHITSGSCTKLVDSFRYLHPSQEKAYTCWSTLLDSRKINYGTRIDYILVSKSVASCLEKAEVWQQIEGSDHCPVFAELAFNLIASQTVPSLCSCNFSSGKQRKLFDFLSQKSKSSGSSLTSSEAKPLGKRPSSTVDIPSAAKARKLESGRKKVASKDSKQSLISFLRPVAAKKPQQFEEHADANDLVDTDDIVDSINSAEEIKSASQESTSESSSSQGDNSEGGKKLSHAWMGVFSGPPKPPPCKVHNEPCVLRTVKKQGPNKNRQFWVCARPGGGKGDPEAKCDFFQWRSTKRK